jgi:hypothetical protein
MPTLNILNPYDIIRCIIIKEENNNLVYTDKGCDMPSEKSYTKLLIKTIFTSGLDDNTDIEIKRKAVLVYIISIIGIINLVPLSIAAFTKDNLILGSFDLVVAGVLIIILLLLRKKGYHIVFSYIGVSFAGALFVYLFATGGVNNTGHVWYYTFPLFTLFLLGSKKGALVTSILPLIRKILKYGSSLLLLWYLHYLFLLNI